MGQNRSIIPTIEAATEFEIARGERSLAHSARRRADRATFVKQSRGRGLRLYSAGMTRVPRPPTSLQASLPGGRCRLCKITTISGGSVGSRLKRLSQPSKNFRRSARLSCVNGMAVGAD